MKLKTLLSVFAVMAVAVFALTAYAGDAPADNAEAKVQSVEVTGQGIIFNNDKALAKDKAIEDGQRKAVEQVVGTLISASTVMQNFQVVDDQILTKSKGYVKSYKILEEKADGGVYIVKMEAQVLLSDVKKDADAISNMLTAKEFPRVMVLIAEQNIGQSGFSYWWGASAGATDLNAAENTIIDNWGKKGFKFVDHQVLAGKVKKNPAYKVVGGQGLGNETAEEIANLADAQLVIVGTVVAKDAGTLMGTNMHSGQADLSVRIINTDTGEIIATKIIHSASVHVNATTAGTQAIQKAATELCDKLLDEVLGKWATGVNSVVLEVEGLKDYKTLGTFKSVLIDEVRGVKGVYDRSFKDGVAEFDVNYQGKTGHFATELESKEFKAFSFKVINKTANKLKIKINAPGGAGGGEKPKK